MTGQPSTVNGETRQGALGSSSMTRKEQLLAFCEEHWKVGWYIAGASTVNVLLNLLNLFV